MNVLCEPGENDVQRALQDSFMFFHRLFVILCDTFDLGFKDERKDLDKKFRKIQEEQEKQLSMQKPE